MSALPNAKRIFSGSLVLLSTLLLLFAAGCSPDAKAKTATAYPGKYKGRGASEEVRFRQTGILTLTVKHQVEFSFKIDEKGNVVGDGQITYDLEKDTQGLDSIAASVRGAMGMVPGVPGAVGSFNQASDVAGKAAEANDAAGTGGNSKNSAGLSYVAPHLKNGPEIRFFRLKGKVETVQLHDGGGQELRLALEVDGDFKRPDGTPDPNLIAQYEVNGQKTEQSFPCWTPFLKGFGVLKKGEGDIWTADFSEKGQNREGKKIWHEYGYYWLVQQKDW